MSALAAKPDCPEVRALARAILSGEVPNWHFALVRDTTRNEAYEAALKRVVRPGSRVLEIGTGTGILAMMAARAGAAEVVTCETNPAVAAAAAEIIARNGYADRVRVVAKHSDDLVVGKDMQGRADVLVSEIISNNLFSESALPVIDAAQRNLLTPDARIIPAVVSTRIALAEGRRPREMGQVSGFDLSAFNRLSHPSRLLSVGDPDLSLRSASHDLFSVDFQSRRYRLADRASATLVSIGGLVNGVVQWLHMQMDAGDVTYENRPSPGRKSCWGAMFHPLLESMQTQPGDEFRVTGAHDSATLYLWAEPKNAS
jgi:type II protein arginine methyltransferase